MIKSSLVAAALVATIVSASAADLASRNAPPVPAPLWSGVYFGTNVGGGWGGGHFNYASNDPSTDLLFGVGGQPPADKSHMGGMMGGIQIGYNWRLQSRWVAGAEADIDLSALTGHDAGATMIGDITRPVTATISTQTKAFGTVRARLGYLPMDTLLVYATAGLAYAKIDQSGDYTMTSGGPIGAVTPPVTFACFPGVSCFNGSSNNWSAGWTVGAGLEYAIAPRWTLGGEYLHARLPSRSVTMAAVSPFPGNPCCSSMTVNQGHTNFDLVRLRLNYAY